MEYRIFFNLLILAVIALLVLTRRMRYIEAIIFLAPFRAVALNIGLSFTAAEVLAILGIGFMLLFRRPERIRLVGSILPYLAYCVISTVFLSIFVVDAVPVKHGNILREEGRFLVQIVLNTLPVYGLLFLIVNHVRNREEVLRGLKAFIAGVTVLVGLAIAQFIIFKGSGVDIFPLGSYTGATRTSVFSAVEQFGGWIRVCSLAGEPKGMAAVASVGLGLLVVAGRFLPGLFSWYSTQAWVFGGVVILTLSTSGVVLAGLLVVVAISFRLIFSRYNWNLFRLTVLIPLLLVAMVAVKSYDTVMVVVENRLLNRIASDSKYTSGGIEDFDQTILAFLADNPSWIIAGSGWGNIHNLSQTYIPPQFAYYMADSIFVAKSGYLKIISESGLIGMMLLLMFEAVTLWQLYQRFWLDKIFKFFFVMVVISFIAFMVRSNYVVYEYIIIHGLALASLSVYTRQRLTQFTVNQ